MKVAFTADLHLKNRKEEPERFKALENILDILKKEKISELIIAGDLFNNEDSGVADFERLCMDNGSVNFHIIPGNHDPLLSTGRLFADNIEVYAEPVLKMLAGIQMMFIPYNGEKSMGESIEEIWGSLEKEKTFYVIGHGDWLGGASETNPMEKGVYMPLSRADVKRYRPQKFILGHIHKAFDGRDIIYPGSPFPLHINETGRRSFILLDPQSGEINRFPVKTEKLYFSEEIFALPLENEINYIKKKLKELKEKWNLSGKEREKTFIRLKVTGFAIDKKNIFQAIKKELSGFKFYDGKADLSNLVHAAGDPERIELAERVIKFIEKELKWDFSVPNSPTKDEVVEKALKVIFK